MRRTLARTAASAALLLAAAGLPAAPAAAFDLEPLVPGPFEQPVHIAGPPGDASQVFVVQKPGTIRRVAGGANTLFLDIRAKVDEDGEEGLLSMAFARDYAQSGRYWILYTADVEGVPGSDLVVEERLRDDDEHAAEIIRIPHRVYNNHNGGQIQVGPDGNLWISTGDGGGGYDPLGNAQDPTRLLGKILRIAPRAGGGYDIPPGNPYASGGGAPEVWAIGLRNPWRFSFDRATGDLWIGDVGQSSAEEIDRVTAAGGLGCGANFGWLPFEGTASTGRGTLTSPHTPPLLHLSRDAGWVSVTGGHVIRDPALGPDVGRYVFGDYTRRSLFLTDGGAPVASGEVVESLSSFGEDGVGRVYAAGIGGSVFRLVAEGGGTSAGAGDAVAFAVNGCAPPGAPGPPAPPTDPTQPPAGEGPRPDAPQAPVTGRPDPRAPRLALAATPRRQRALRRRTLLVRVRCDVACRVTATATLRRRALRPASASLRAGRTRTLRLRLPRRARRAGRARVVVRATATGSGRTTRRVLRIRVAR